MGNPYDRLGEVDAITRVLAADVERLKGRLGELSIQAETSERQMGARRAYVRAVFALVEAIIEQHKRLLLDLSPRFVALGPGVAEALAERAHDVNDAGIVRVRGKYLPLRQKLRAVYRAAGDAFAAPLEVQYADTGWRSFMAANKVRDRITHPKSYDDCDVTEEDLADVSAGESWFRGVSNEFVRVARMHRQSHGW